MENDYNKEGYKQWAESYDHVANKTRDIEVKAIQTTSKKYGYRFNHTLEIGCGTGKNTEWLANISNYVLAVDFSTEMLQKAKEKVTNTNVVFLEADISKKWDFTDKAFDLITCSLVLEYIRDINHVFQQANSLLRSNGLFYIGELHPFRQYQGEKAKFDHEEGVFELECVTRNISAFFQTGIKNGFDCIDLSEWKAHEDEYPRLLSMLFQKRKIF